jgi:hypothetical protein
VLDLRRAGAVLLRHIYESGIAYDNPEVEGALAVFAEHGQAAENLKQQRAAERKG